MYALVLQNMGDPARWREAIADLELSFPRYAENVRCIVHDAAMPVPGYIRDFPFDLIVINSTVLGAVTDAHSLENLRDRYAFIAHSPAFKVALPQDDYYCSEELDTLLTDWAMDVVYTVCPEHWGTLYPRFLASGGALELGYTGYVTPRMRRLGDTAIERNRRRFDVVYRATGRPGFPNEMGMVKAQLGARFLERFRNRRWVTDITTDSKRVITGRAWWRFLADSRMTLGSNSGSSVLIRNLDVATKIRDYARVNPAADYDEIVTRCIPEADRGLEFTAISPRVVEAALVETTQLLVPGPYSGVISAGQHYWPLAADCSNGDEIIRLMEDRALQTRIAKQCKAVILDTHALQIETLIADITGRVARRPGATGASATLFARTHARYLADAGLKTHVHYLRERARRNAPAWVRDVYHRARALGHE